MLKVHFNYDIVFLKTFLGLGYFVALLISLKSCLYFL